MKQVVIKRFLKQEDSTLNRQFEDLAGSYGFELLDELVAVDVISGKEAARPRGQMGLAYARRAEEHLVGTNFAPLLPDGTRKHLPYLPLRTRLVSI